MAIYSETSEEPQWLDRNAINKKNNFHSEFRQSLHYFVVNFSDNVVLNIRIRRFNSTMRHTFLKSGLNSRNETFEFVVDLAFRH